MQDTDAAKRACQKLNRHTIKVIILQLKEFIRQAKYYRSSSEKVRLRWKVV